MYTFAYHKFLSTRKTKQTHFATLECFKNLNQKYHEINRILKRKKLYGLVGGAHRKRINLVIIRGIGE